MCSVHVGVCYFVVHSGLAAECALQGVSVPCKWQVLPGGWPTCRAPMHAPGCGLVAVGDSG